MGNEWLEYHLNKFKYDGLSNLRVRVSVPYQLIWQNNIDFNEGSFVDTEINGGDDAAVVRPKNITDLDDDIDYVTAGDYTLSDGAKLEVNGSKIALKPTTGDTNSWPFTTSGNYTFDALKIAVTGGVAKLIGGLVDGMEAYFKMDEASWDGTPGEVTDSSANSNDGQAIGDAAITAGGLFGNLGTFDGTGDSISIPHHASISFETTDSFSFQCWIKTTDSNTLALMSKQQVSGAFGINLQSSSGKLRFNLVGSTGSLAVDSTNTIDDDVIHHIIVTYDGSEDVSGVHIYIDDNDETLSTVANALSGSIVTSVPFRLADRESGSQPYAGLMDEVVIWSRELSAANVTSLYNSGSGLEIVFFPTDSPKIENDTGFAFSTTISAFNETATKPSGTAIKYQVSSDDGSIFEWWDGGAWVERTILSVVTTVNTTTGTVDAGNLASLQTLDGSTYDVSELGANPGFVIEMDMSNVNAAGPDNVVIHGYYDGSHTNVNVDIWDFNTSAWVTLGQIATGGGSVVEQSYAVTGSKSDKVEAGVVKIRINHDEMGNASHNIFLDYVYVDAPPTDEWWYDNETNTVADVDTNISTLAASGTFKFIAFLDSDGNDTPLLDNIEIQESPEYSTDDNLYGDTKDASQLSVSDVIAWLTLTISNVNPANTDIGILFSIDDRVSWLTWSGSAWVAPASATTRTDATSIADAQTNIASLGLGNTFDVRVFLRTTDVNETPEVSNINVTGDKGVETSGTWESNIFNSSLSSLNWGKISFTVETPVGTSITIVGKASNKSNLTDASYGSALSNGEETELTGQYIQFKATFAGTISARSELDDIGVVYQVPDFLEVSP